MNQFLDKARDGFWRLYDWCMANKKAALAAVGCIALFVMMISVMFCGSRKLADGTDETGSVTWSYHADGRLRFSDQGEVVGQQTDFSESGTTIHQPEWYECHDEVIAIEIGEEITYVAMDAFV